MLRTIGLLLLAGCSTPAFAYLDPGLGSMLISAVLGVFATLALTFKSIWYRLRNWLRGTPPPSLTVDEPAKSSDASKHKEETDA